MSESGTGGFSAAERRTAVVTTSDGTGDLPRDLTLRELDETLLEGVRDVAVADASPREVMPVPPRTNGWTPSLAQAFLDHHRARFDGLSGHHGELCFVVEQAGRPVGVARLARHTSGSMEAGLWLARTARSRGIGTEVLALLQAAAAARDATLIARTTADNRAAVAVLARAGARITEDADGSVEASLPPATT